MPKTANTGNIPLTASATLTMAFTTCKAPVAMFWKVFEEPISLNKAKNSSLTFDIWLAKDSCALTASVVKEFWPDWATDNACWAVPNSWIKGITLPICRNPPSSSTILENFKSLGSILFKPLDNSSTAL